MEHDDRSLGTISGHMPGLMALIDAVGNAGFQLVELLVFLPVFAMVGYPCCCSPPDDCPNLCSGPKPATGFQIEFTGWADQDCTDCTVLDGTWTLTEAVTCVWDYSLHDDVYGVLDLPCTSGFGTVCNDATGVSHIRFQFFNLGLSMWRAHCEVFLATAFGSHCGTLKVLEITYEFYKNFGTIPDCDTFTDTLPYQNTTLSGTNLLDSCDPTGVTCTVTAL